VISNQVGTKKQIKLLDIESNFNFTGWVSDLTPYLEIADVGTSIKLSSVVVYVNDIIVFNGNEGWKNNYSGTKQTRKSFHLLIIFYPSLLHH
jgi:hypothetical protein